MTIVNTGVNIVMILILVMVASIYYKGNSDTLSFLICSGAIFGVLCMASYKYKTEYVEGFYGDINFSNETRSALDIYYPPVDNRNEKDICNECDGLCIHGNIGINAPYMCNNYDFSSELTMYKYIDINLDTNGVQYFKKVLGKNIIINKAIILITKETITSTDCIYIIKVTSGSGTKCTEWGKCVFKGSKSDLNNRNINMFDQTINCDKYGNLLVNGKVIGKWKYSNMNYINDKKWIERQNSIDYPLKYTLSEEDKSLNKEGVMPSYTDGLPATCDDTISIVSREFCQIIGPKSKFLSFDASGIDTDVYTSGSAGNFCKTQVPGQYIKNKQVGERTSLIQQTVEYDFEDPQQWTIKFSDEALQNCAVFICTYSRNKDKPIYYLTASKSGEITMSLFGGSSSQMWYLINTGEDVQDSFLLSTLQANISDIFDSYNEYINKINKKNKNDVSDCTDTQWGCCPGEKTSKTDKNGSNCKTKCTILKNHQLSDAKEKATKILSSTTTTLKDKLVKMNTIIKDCYLYVCSPCYKAILNAYPSASNNNPTVPSNKSSIYHIKSAKYNSYLTTERGGSTIMNGDKVALSGSLSERSVWNIMGNGKTIKKNSFVPNKPTVSYYAPSDFPSHETTERGLWFKEYNPVWNGDWMIHHSGSAPVMAHIKIDDSSNENANITGIVILPSFGQSSGRHNGATYHVRNIGSNILVGENGDDSLYVEMVSPANINGDILPRIKMAVNSKGLWNNVAGKDSNNYSTLAIKLPNSQSVASIRNTLNSLYGLYTINAKNDIAIPSSLLPNTIGQSGL